jgi:hypothetical protein
MHSALFIFISNIFFVILKQCYLFQNLNLRLFRLIINKKIFEIYFFVIIKIMKSEFPQINNH